MKNSTRSCRTLRRRHLAAAAATLVLVAGAGACRPGGGGGTTGSGNGAVYEADPGLAKHTIYHPADLATVTSPMPVVVWGNGGCSGDGAGFKNFLLPLAGKGVLIVASGAPGGTGQTTAAMLTQSLDWVVAESNRAGSKYQGKIDATRISAMGQSCGGLEAVVAGGDPRVKSTVLWNSGIFASGGLGGATKAALTKLHGPTAWLHGGTSDIAYPQAVDDYAQVPSSVPAVLGGYKNVGHGGLFFSAGLAPADTAVVAKYWIDASLYNDAAAKAQFVGANCGLCSTGWSMQSKNW